MEETIRGLSEEQLQEWLYRFQLDHFLEEFDSEEARRTLLGLWRSINTDREQTVECVEQLRDFRKEREGINCENEYTLSDFETKNLPGGRLLLVKEKDSVYCFDKNNDLDELLREKKNPFTRTPFNEEILEELNESKLDGLYSLEVEELEDELDNLFFGKDYAVIEIKVSDLKAEIEKLIRALELADYSYEASLVPSFATDFDREQYLLYSPSEEWRKVMQTILEDENRDKVALRVLKAINLNIQLNEEPNVAIYETSLHLKNFFNKIELENEFDQERRDQLTREIDENEQYIDVRYKPVYAPSAIHSARVGDLEQLRYLFEGVDIESDYAFELLQVALERGHLDVVKFLVSKGADVKRKDGPGNTPLHLASREGHLDIVEFLILEGANVKARNELKRTPLHLTSIGGHLDVAKFLVSEGADVKKRDAIGNTPLYLASHYGHLDVANFLVSKGADVNQKNMDGVTLLHIASEVGHLNVVKFLVSEGANVNTKNEDGEAPLHLASEEGHLDIVKFLVSEGADVKESDDYGITPLHLASGEGRLDIVKFLVSEGADVSARNESGLTPLHLASGVGHLDVVKFLISEGANVNAKGMNKYTPLHSASEGGHLNVVKFLVSEGADVSARNESGITPLRLASGEGHLDVVKFLVSEGADVKASDEFGITPLHLASEEGYLKIVKFLVSEGANVNVKDRNKYTPLHLALGVGHKNVVKFLKSKGAK